MGAQLKFNFYFAAAIFYIVLSKHNRFSKVPSPLDYFLSDVATLDMPTLVWTEVWFQSAMIQSMQHSIANNRRFNCWNTNVSIIRTDKNPKNANFSFFILLLERFLFSNYLLCNKK